MLFNNVAGDRKMGIIFFDNCDKDCDVCALNDQCLADLLRVIHSGRRSMVQLALMTAACSPLNFYQKILHKLEQTHNNPMIFPRYDNSFFLDNLKLYRRQQEKLYRFSKEISGIFQENAGHISEWVFAAIQEDINKALMVGLAILKFSRNDLLEPAMEAVKQKIFAQPEYQDVKNFLFDLANTFVFLNKEAMIKNEIMNIHQPPKFKTVLTNIAILPAGLCGFITQEEETGFYN